MNRLVNFLKAVALLLLLLAMTAYMLPDRRVVERQRVIAQTAERIWPLVASPRAWVRWAPWPLGDPGMRLTYRGPDTGAGAEWSWESDAQGRGTVRFVSAQPPTRLSYTVVFEDTGTTASGEFRLESAGAAATRVIWSIESGAGMNPLMRWFGLLAQPRVAQDFDLGLEGLARAAGG
ncbi:MAG: hypothetical protein RL456_1179 [Pseudomonadota bacterium]|jgi:uncharacterized protein YndB with AHSA1/START domain